MVYELSVVSLVHPDGGVIHAIAGVDEFVKDDNGDTLLCGMLHDEDDDDWKDCPVASRWTLLISR